jgi:hypothetical protein
MPPKVNEADPNAWIDQTHWQALAAAQLSASQDHDKAILTLASGTLALSATFVHDIAPNPVGCSVALLIVSWVALVASIVFIVLSYQASQWTMQAAMQEKDASRRNKIAWDSTLPPT